MLKQKEILSMHQIKTRDSARKVREEKLLEILKEYFQENGNLAVPQDYEYIDASGEMLHLGRMLERVKKYVREENSDYIFSDKFIESVVAMDPRVFELNYSRNLEKEKKEDKILRMCKQYFFENGNLAISARYVHKDTVTGEEFKLGKEICCIKEFRKNIGRRYYSEKLMNDLEKIDKNVFNPDYSRKNNRCKDK